MRTTASALGWPRSRPRSRTTIGSAASCCAGRSVATRSITRATPCVSPAWTSCRSRTTKGASSLQATSGTSLTGWGRRYRGGRGATDPRWCVRRPPKGRFWRSSRAIRCASDPNASGWLVGSRSIPSSSLGSRAIPSSESACHCHTTRPTPTPASWSSARSSHFPMSMRWMVPGGSSRRASS